MLQDLFNTDTRAEIDTARIEIARVRLARAEQMVTLRRSELAVLPCGSLERQSVLQLVQMCERAVFNRRLELDMLLRARRQRRDLDQRP
jgi:hypothetical protein